MTSRTSAYLAPFGFAAPLLAELRLAGLKPSSLVANGRLVLVDEAPEGTTGFLWAQNTWHDVQRVPVTSVASAAAHLRAQQRNWARLWPTSAAGGGLTRRSQLIEQALPPLRRSLRFPGCVQTVGAYRDSPMGSWTLLAPDVMLCAARCSSLFAHGELHFDEDKRGPPSRAYLKLWEAFTRLGRIPLPSDVCVDLGSSPGGWTWALQQLGVKAVVSVDKAPLDPAVAQLPNVHFVKESAFGIDPRRALEAVPGAQRVNWLFSDIACYPERLLRLVRTWIDSGLVDNIVCTIKFQHETDFDAIARFRALPNSSLVHLHNNKHELTWIYLSS